MFFRKFGAPALDPAQQAINVHSKTSDMTNHDVMLVLTSEAFVGDVEQGQATAVSYAQQRIRYLILIASGDFSPLKDNVFAQRAKLFENPQVATELSIVALRIIAGRSLIERQRSVVVPLGVVWGSCLAPSGVRPAPGATRQPPAPIDMLVGDHIASVRIVVAALKTAVDSLAKGGGSVENEVAAAQHAILVLGAIVAAIGRTSTVVSQFPFTEVLPAGDVAVEDALAAESYKATIEIILGTFLEVAQVADEAGRSLSVSSQTTRMAAAAVIDEIGLSFPAVVANHPFVSNVVGRLVLRTGQLEGRLPQFCTLLVSSLSLDVFSVTPSASVGGIALDTVLTLLASQADAAGLFVELSVSWEGLSPKTDLLDVICSDRVRAWSKHVAEYVIRTLRADPLLLSESKSVLALLHADVASLPKSAVRRTNDRGSAIFVVRLLCSLIVESFTNAQQPQPDVIIAILSGAVCALADPFMSEVAKLLDGMEKLKMNSITVNHVCAMLRDFDVLLDTVVELGSNPAAASAVPPDLKRLASRWFPTFVQQVLKLPLRSTLWSEGFASNICGGFGAVLASVVKAAEERHASLQDNRLLAGSFGQVSLFDAENQLLLLEGQKGTPTPDPSFPSAPGQSPQTSKELRRSGRVHRQHSFDITDVWKLDVDEVKDVVSSPRQPHRSLHGRAPSNDVIAEILGTQAPLGGSVDVVDLFSGIPKTANTPVILSSGGGGGVSQPPGVAINLFESAPATFPHLQPADVVSQPLPVVNLFEAFGVQSTPPARSQPAAVVAPNDGHSSSSSFDDFFAAISTAPPSGDGPRLNGWPQQGTSPQPVAQQSLSLFDLFSTTQKT